MKVAYLINDSAVTTSTTCLRIHMDILTCPALNKGTVAGLGQGRQGSKTRAGKQHNSVPLVLKQGVSCKHVDMGNNHSIS